MATLNFWVWAAQAVLAGLFGLAGVAKAFRPKDALSSTMAWVDDYSGPFVKFVGAVEILGALGMILPMVTGIFPWLTPLAAVGFIIIQILGISLHARRGETAKTLPVNIVLLALALFVVWGRWELS